LKSIYKPIRETYKFYAGISPCGYVPCIGQKAFDEIINLTNLVDGKDLKFSDVDFEFIATKAGNKNVLLNPERWLVRYQLMEIFVRIALHKYYKSQKDNNDKLTQSMAIKKLFEDHLLVHFKKHDSNKWRIEKLWNKGIDDMIKSNYQQSQTPVYFSNLKYLKKLYEIYSGKYTKPGKTKFMSMEEFVSLISHSGALKSATIGITDLGSIFNVSIMTQINELDYDRHTQMTLMEFIEAICRVANKLVEIPEVKNCNQRWTVNFGKYMYY